MASQIVTDQRTVTEWHHVIAGGISLGSPVVSVQRVRATDDPEDAWSTLRANGGYDVLDAERGQLYVAAPVGALVEVTYTTPIEKQP